MITTAGRSTREDRLEALSAGAWDFIGLPLDADDLILRLNAYMRAKLEAELTKEEGLIDPGRAEEGNRRRLPLEEIPEDLDCVSQISRGCLIR